MTAPPLRNIYIVGSDPHTHPTLFISARTMALIRAEAEVMADEYEKTTEEGGLDDETAHGRMGIGVDVEDRGAANDGGAS